jgi:hypothetical protein
MLSSNQLDLREDNLVAEFGVTSQNPVSPQKPLSNHNFFRNLVKIVKIRKEIISKDSSLLQRTVNLNTLYAFFR